MYIHVLEHKKRCIETEPHDEWAQSPPQSKNEAASNDGKYAKLNQAARWVISLMIHCWSLE
jgi:hypothetical protein